MYTNNSTMQMYSVSTNYGVQIGNEIIRISAITGARIDSDTFDNDRFPGDDLNELKRLQAYLSEDSGAFKIYLLGYGNSVSLKIMTPFAYDLIKKPNIRLIKMWSIGEVLDGVIAAGESDFDLENASSREGIRSVVPDMDLISLARQMKAWIAGEFEGQEVSEAFTYGTGYVFSAMTPKVITTLAGYAGHAQYYNKAWSVHNYAAWEELRAHAEDDMAARELHNRVSVIQP